MKKQIPFGKYLLIDRINVGGMAEVYKAKTVGVEGFEKLLAIKRILPNIAEDDEFITMFIDEAKISVQLTHSNIAQIYDLGKIGESYFIAMEYISGKDMRGIFDRMRKRGEPLPIPMTCYMVSKLCEGLDYAHRKKDAAGRDLGIVHRDISPQNVLISFEGEVKVIDFGIAKAANKASRTQAGILKGKFGYMSPEQVRGLPIDRRSDVFAVGVCLFEQLTGERLFYGESDFSTLEKVRTVDVVPPSTYNPRIPEALDAIVMKALAKDVEDRYQWGSELGDDLQRFLITSDSIFGRADLANFMKATFAEDLEREKVKNQEALLGDESSSEPKPDPFSDEVPGEAEGADSTQLFDPTSEFDDQPKSPSEGAKPPGPPGPPPGPPPGSPPGRPPAAGPPGAGRPPAGGPRSGAAGGGGAPPGFRGPAGPGPNRPGGRPPGAMPKVPPQVGSLADLEDDDDEPSTIAEEAPAGAPGRKPKQKAPPKVSKKAPSGGGGIGWKVPVLAVLLLVALAGGAVFAYPHVFGDDGPDKGVMIVRGQPRGAKVYVDGVPVGEIPFADSSAAIGGRTVVVKAEGYAPYEEQVVVLPGEHMRLSVELEETAGAPASLLIVTVPLDADVVLNGEVVKEGGDDPWRSSEIPSDEKHEIVVRRDGYWPESIEWKPEPGEDRTITFTLREAKARLVVNSSPSRARVYLDGERMGRTPLTLDDIDGSRRYSLEVKRGGCYEDWDTTLIFDGQPERELEIDLERIPGCGRGSRPPAKQTPPTKKQPTETETKQPEGTGMLSLNTRPGWAWVIIDGEETGRSTPLVNYELPAGRHTVVLRAPDGREETIQVQISPDEATRRTVDLE